MRWLLAVVVGGLIADIKQHNEVNPFTAHVAALNRQKPWQSAYKRISEAFAMVKDDHTNQEKFQKEKAAGCNERIKTTQDTIKETERSTALLADNRIKLEADVEAQKGTITDLEDKLKKIQVELESAKTQRKKVDAKNASLLLAAKQALVSADIATQEENVDASTQRTVLQTQLATMEAAHDKQAVLLSQFTNGKRDELQRVENKLQEARTELLDRETELAEVVRTLNDNERTRTRDKKYLKSVKEVCTLFGKHEKKLRKSRGRLVDLLKLIVKQVKDKAEDAGRQNLLLADITALSQPASFMQVKIQNTDVFAMVRDKIREMMQAMEEEVNKDKTKHEWCQKEMQNNDKDRIAFRDNMNTNKRQIQYIMDQQKALDRAHAFAQDAKAKNKQILEDTKKETKKLDERFKLATDHSKIMLETFKKIDEMAQTKTGEGGVPRILSFLSEAMAENQKLIELVDSAKSEMLQNNHELQENAQGAAAARDRDAQDVEMERSELVDNLVQHRTDLKMAQNNLDTAVEYQETLRQDCGPGNDVEKAMKRRQEEIEALQDALKVLNGEMIA